MTPQQILISAVSVLITLVVSSVYNWIMNVPKKKKQEEQQDILMCKKGIQALLKNDLKVRYDFWINEGYAPEDAKDDLEDEYKIYHSLGKNGVMDSRREKVLRLPSEPPTKNKEE